MKTALYIEDGSMQLVITPENDFERDALRSFGDGPVDAKIFRGAFYDCRGGWVRQAAVDVEDHHSLIVRVAANKHPEGAPGAPDSSANNNLRGGG